MLDTGAYLMRLPLNSSIFPGLTPREIDVLRLIASGNANKDIANHLSVGEASVKSHVANTLSKLNANDHAHAVTIFLCEPYAANSGSVKSVYGICLPVVTRWPPVRLSRDDPKIINANVG
jgi:DNA-binding CsgD family transcriptional regulator